MGSSASGGCVLMVVVGVPIAGVFAASPEAGVLTVWGVGVACIWWSARRRVSVPSATPPPEGVAPSGDVYAGGPERLARVEYKASGVQCTLHVMREEVTGE